MDNKIYKAAVIGAGPAGITTVANLLELHIGPILWIDPEFKCGKLNSYYNVPGNTKVKYFLGYFNHLKIFSELGVDFGKFFEDFDPEETCPLLFMINALKQAMKLFLQMDEVYKLKSTVKKIEYTDGHHVIDDKHVAEYVFFCTGSVPTGLSIHSAKQQVLDMITIISDDYSDLEKEDKIAVFGSSHSAMLAIMNLYKYTENIVNFYRDEIVYAEPKDGWILYDDTGLKGKVATWTKENVHKLKRIHISDPRYQEEFERCSKVLYCTGFTRLPLPKLIVDGKEVETKKLQYDLETGRIEEKLYGFGIAFPKQVTDPVGNKEFSVGIWKFMKHISCVVPQLFPKEKKMAQVAAEKL